MGRKRRIHSDELKAKVAIEALRGLKTASELAAAYDVHPVQISQWKRQLLDQAATLFAPGRARPAEQNQDKLVADLYEEIGRLKMELDWTKKKAALLG